MSSLLSNDFNEEYFRLTKNLETNYQACVVDRNNRLVFTTEFETEDTIAVTGESFANTKITPQNANIIFDSITLFSCNPNVGNLLPIRLSFDDKPTIEFSEAYQFVTLKDFRVVTDPPLLEADVQNHRYGDLTLHNITGFNGDMLALHEFDNIVYLSTDGDPTIWKIDITGVNPKVLLTNVPPISTFKSNSRHVVGINVGRFALFNVRKDRFIISVTPPAFIIDFWIKGDILIWIYATAAGEPSIGWFNLSNADDETDQEFYEVDLFAEIGAAIDFFDIIDSDTIVACVVEFAYFIRFTGDATKISNVVELTNRPAFDSIGVFSSGENKENPIAVVLSKESNSLVAYSCNINDENVGRVVLLKNGQFTSVPTFYKYINQVMWVDTEEDRKLRILNLDTLTLVTYNFNIRNFSSFRFVPNAYFEGGVDLSWNRWSLLNAYQQDDVIWINRLKNERTVNEVYKITYDLDERAFPFDVTQRTKLDFTITLPNKGTTADLEIFNYVIDYRIRYSKQKDNPNPTVPQIKGKKVVEQVDKDGEVVLRRNKRLVRQGETVRETDDILGLVDPDQFNVQDFLQIYNPN